MVDTHEIDLALSAHAMWKTRLKQLITEGELTEDVESLRRDDLCRFGKWLNSLEEHACESAEFDVVRRLHAEFHHVAAEVAAHALAGDRAKASAMLEADGAYNAASSRLADALTSWKASLE